MPLKPTRSLANVVVVLLGVQIVGSLAEIAGLIHRLGVLTQIQAGTPVGTAARTDADNAVSTAAGILGLAFLATVVLWCMWQHAAQANAIQLNYGGLKYTPGWAVGWWFIPFANLVKPYQTVSELWRTSHRRDPTKSLASRLLLPFWWALWLLSNLHIWYGGSSRGINFGTASTGTAGSPTTIDGWINHDRWMIGSLVLSVAAAALAIVIVRSIDRRQATEAATWSPLIPPAPGMPPAPGALPPPPPIR